MPAIFYFIEKNVKHIHQNVRNFKKPHYRDAGIYYIISSTYLNEVFQN